jgi:hypothetical protein
MKTTLTDGLYRVTTHSFCAGFTVKNGAVLICAPILARRLGYWLQHAVLVSA